MSIKDEVEQELRAYLAKEPDMSRQDRLGYLLSIFDKHLIFATSDYKMQYYDVSNVINGAKRYMSEQHMPVEISRKTLSPNEAVHIALIESLIGFLNQKEVLKKLVKLDYTQGEK